MTIKHAILTLDFEVDPNGNPDAALEDILGSIRIALSGSTSIGAGAVELGAIVQNIEVVEAINHSEFIDRLIKARSKQYSERFEGSITGFCNDEKDVLTYYGHCNKVHPDLKDTYPNGWSMHQDETIDDSMKAMGWAINVAQQYINEEP